MAQIFNNLLRRQIGSRFPTAEHISTKPEILKILIDGYDNQEISLHCGMILRECIRHESLAKVVLDSQDFWRFFILVELSTFDIASDAFANFRELLTRHKGIVAGFLETHYDVVRTMFVVVSCLLQFITTKIDTSHHSSLKNTQHCSTLKTTLPNDSHLNY